MKKTIVLAVVVGLVAASFAAPAVAKKKKKKNQRVERTVEASYTFPAGIGSSDLGGACAGCPSFPNAADETWVSVEVVDDTTGDAGVSFSWDTDGDGISDTGFEVCGKTEAPIQIPGGITINAFPWHVPGSACPTGPATEGTIKVTFSNMP